MPLVILSKFELGIGNDDASSQRVLRRTLVNSHGNIPHLLRELFADHPLHRFEADVFVVISRIGFGRRGEQSPRKPGCLLESRRQFDAAQLPGLLVVAPAGTDEVAAHDCLDGQWLKPSRDDRTLLERLQHCILGDYGIQCAIRKVIRNEVLHHLEPEIRDLCQYLPLARHGIGHYDVIG